MKKAKAKKPPKDVPSQKKLQDLTKAALGQNGMIDFYWPGRVFVRNEEDVSLEIESNTKGSTYRLALCVLEAVKKHRKLEARKTGRKP